MGRTYAHCFGQQIERTKEKNRERDMALICDGFCWMEGLSFGGKGMQDVDHGGGCCHIAMAIEIGGKK